MSKKETVTKNKGGRPSTFRLAVMLRILERVTNGESEVSAARAEGVAWSTYHGWKNHSKEVSARYAHAREASLLYLESKLIANIEEAEAAAHDAENGRLRLDAVKIQSDIIKWMLSKRLPKQYGDRSALEVTGREGEPLMPQRTRPEMEEFAAILAAAQARVRGGDNGTG